MSEKIDPRIGFFGEDGSIAAYPEVDIDNRAFSIPPGTIQDLGKRRFIVVGTNTPESQIEAMRVIADRQVPDEDHIPDDPRVARNPRLARLQERDRTPVIVETGEDKPEPVVETPPEPTPPPHGRFGKASEKKTDTDTKESGG